MSQEVITPQSIPSTSKIKSMLGFLHRFIMDKKNLMAIGMAVQFILMQQFPIKGIKPDLVVGFIPIYHVNKVGHASSDEILKYRAMGGVFLAHQKGGRQTFHLRCLLIGPQRFLLLKLLEGLQMIGVEAAKKIAGQGGLSNAGGVITTLGGEGKVVDPSSLTKTKDRTPLTEFTGRGEFKDQEYAFHSTYPIITPTRIYTDMYMETLVMKEDVRLGTDVIEVQCAFRQYLPPTTFQRSLIRGDVDFNKDHRRFYRVYRSDSEVKYTQRADNLLNFLWLSTMMTRDVMYNEAEYYKISTLPATKAAIDVLVTAGLYLFAAGLGRLK